MSKTAEWQENLGPPDIKLDGLQIWVHGRQFEDHHDYWDGNWLRVTVHCSAVGADVWTTGFIIHLPELLSWQSESKQLFDTLKGEAKLACMEPSLGVTLKAQSQGHIEMEVFITPDQITQRHEFKFEIDQSYLSQFLKQFATVLEKFPLRGDRNDPQKERPK